MKGFYEDKYQTYKQYVNEHLDDESNKIALYSFFGIKHQATEDKQSDTANTAKENKQ